MEEGKALKFQDGLKPYLRNKISIIKLGIHSKVVDRALIAGNEIMKSFISIGNNKEKGIGVIVLMVTNHIKGLPELEIKRKGR